MSRGPPSSPIPERRTRSGTTRCPTTRSTTSLPAKAPSTTCRPGAPAVPAVLTNRRRTDQSEERTGAGASQSPQVGGRTPRGVGTCAACQVFGSESIQRGGGHRGRREVASATTDAEEPEKPQDEAPTDSRPVADATEHNAVDEQEQPQRPDGPVTVRVATSRPDWTGHRDVEVITADDVLAAGQWDERCWRRA